MKTERRLFARLAMPAVLFAAPLPLFGFSCFPGTVSKNEAGVEIHIENPGLDPIQFSHGSSNTRVATNESKLVAKAVVDAEPGSIDPNVFIPMDAQAGLKLKQMDMDLGTVYVFIPGTELEAGKVTEFFVGMNAPECFRFEFTRENPAGGLNYRRS